MVEYNYAKIMMNWMYNQISDDKEWSTIISRRKKDRYTINQDDYKGDVQSYKWRWYWAIDEHDYGNKEWSDEEMTMMIDDNK